MSADPPIDNNTDQDELLTMLKALRAEHRVLDEEVGALVQNGAVDMVNLRRMKKIKLTLKDRIAVIEDMLTPNIIA